VARFRRAFLSISVVARISRSRWRDAPGRATVSVSIGAPLAPGDGARSACPVGQGAITASRRLAAAFVCYRKCPVSLDSEPYEGVTGGSVAQRKCANALFSRDLRRLEYASSNQVVGGSNLSGRTIINNLHALFFVL